MGDYYLWRSLRELDEAAGVPKGTAFRAFKAALPTLTEGRDFIVLDHQIHAALAAALHSQGRLYRSSVHPVLLEPAVAERLAQRLAGVSGAP